MKSILRDKNAIENQKDTIDINLAHNSIDKFCIPKQELHGYPYYSNQNQKEMKNERFSSKSRVLKIIGAFGDKDGNSIAERQQFSESVTPNKNDKMKSEYQS